jgi:hypothetical protein
MISSRRALVPAEYNIFPKYVVGSSKVVKLKEDKVTPREELSE